MPQPDRRKKDDKDKDKENLKSSCYVRNRMCSESRLAVVAASSVAVLCYGVLCCILLLCSIYVMLFCVRLHSTVLISDEEEDCHFILNSGVIRKYNM